MLWSIDTCQNKVSADQYHVPICAGSSLQLKFTAHRGHVFFVSLPLTKFWFSIGSRAHVSKKVKKAGLIGSRVTLIQN